MTATTTPAPRPLCAAFAPLLPLLSSGALEEHEAMPTREHVAGCAWCQQELARYAAVDEALRREFGATHENILPFPFDLDGDEDAAEDYAFTLEDTLEETMAEGHDPRDSQPSTTTRSSRWGDEETRAKSTRDGHRRDRGGADPRGGRHGGLCAVRRTPHDFFPCRHQDQQRLHQGRLAEREITHNHPVDDRARRQSLVC